MKVTDRSNAHPERASRKLIRQKYRIRARPEPQIPPGFCEAARMWAHLASARRGAQVPHSNEGVDRSQFGALGAACTRKMRAARIHERRSLASRRSNCVFGTTPV